MPKAPITSKRAYIKAVAELNNEIKRKRPHLKKRFLRSEAEEKYKEYKGSCAFCGINLLVAESNSSHALRYSFYIPLEVGGVIDTFNIVPCCPSHKEENDRKIAIRDHIPDIDTLGDLIHILIETVLENRETPTPELKEKLRRIKRTINSELNNIVVTARYSYLEDWAPEEMSLLVEEKNTLPDLVEKIVEEKDTKESIQKLTGQMLTTKQYKIIRKR